MNILWLSDSPMTTTGYSTISQNICNKLVEAGHQVFFIAHNYIGQPIPPGLTLQDGTKYNFWIHGGSPKPYAQDLIVPMIKKYNIDVFGILLDTFMLYPWILNLDFSPAKTIFYFPSDGGGGMPLGCENILKKVNCPVAMSRFGQRQVKELYNVDTKYIPHAVDLKNYYPGNTLITARDILNLWVARMIFSGLEFMKDVPFHNVFIHGTILTKDGKRMSKSLGTGIDPLKYINEFGADATRFAIVWQANGQDIKWDESALFAGKKFANKIWNASRFVLQQVGDSNLKVGNIKPNPKTSFDKKILKQLKETKENLEKDIESFEFSKAIRSLYDFFWHDFCDVYLEESKKQINENNGIENTKEILLFVLFESLKMIHPFMPFVTETIYQDTNREKSYLMVETW